MYLNTLNRILIWCIAFYVSWRCYHFDRSIIGTEHVEITPHLTLHVWFNMIGVRKHQQHRPITKQKLVQSFEQMIFIFFQLQLLMVESIMMFSEHNPLSLLHTTRTKRIIHLTMQISGVSFIVIGTVILFVKRYECEHFFKSWHTITGKFHSNE